jgi:hypothetical protein
LSKARSNFNPFNSKFDTSVSSTIPANVPPYL